MNKSDLITQIHTLRNQGATNTEIGLRLGKTREQIRDLLKSNPVPKLDDKSEFWRAEATRLSRELEKANAHKAAIDVLVEEVQNIAPIKYSPPKGHSLDLGNRGHNSSQSAVLMLSDQHIGAVVKPEQTLGFGGYDFPTFLRRLKRLEKSVVSILQDHTTTPVDELVIPMLGDALDGALTHGAEVGQLNTLFSQFFSGGHALAQFLRNLSVLVPRVRVYTTAGNHPRFPHQHKGCPTKNRFSNLDTFLVSYIKALLQDCPKINIELTTQPMAEFEVKGFKFLAGHGDWLKGGDKALGIPSHAIGRAVSAMAQLRAKHGLPGINYYLLGHFHRVMELCHAQGQILVNGSFVGLDEFGISQGFVPCPPVQKMFLMHSKFGRSACYDLNLTFAETKGIPYDMPPEFPLQ